MSNNYSKGPIVGYKCPKCGFDTNQAHCDSCNAPLRWDKNIGGSAHCSGCGNSVTGIKCRKCGNRFSI